MEKETNNSNSSIQNFYQIFHIKNAEANGLPAKAKSFNQPDHFTNLLYEKVNYLKKIIEIKQADLKNSPSGNLVVHKKGENVEYFLSDKTIKEKYISKKDSQLIHRLAQKAYDNKLLKISQKQYSLLSQVLQKYDENEISSLYNNLSTQRQSLINPIEASIQEFVQSWESFEYPTRQFEKDSPEITTNRGERVQSKSERLIANALHKNQIPYRYEFPIYFPSNNATYHPDFLALNTRTRKVYLWEHLGIMDNPNYVANNMNRLRTYEKSGFLPGINLILTFEDKNHPLNQTTVDEYIRYYLS